MVEEPSHVKQLSLNQVCKIGLRLPLMRIINFMHRRRILCTLQFPSMAIKFFYAPERPEQGDEVPLCTCSSTPPPPPSMGPGNLEFFGPQMALAYRLDDNSQGPKNYISISTAQPPPTCPHTGYALIQNIMHGTV
jgi:hypothetical protein